MQSTHTVNEVKSLLAANTSSGSMPLFSSIHTQLPGAVNADPDPIPEEDDEVAELPPPSLEEAAEDFISNQRCLLTIDYECIKEALKLLDSKKYLVETNICCDTAKDVCCEHRLEGLAGLLVCCLVGGCYGFLGFFAKMTHSSCINKQHQAFNKLLPDEVKSLQQHLVVIKLDTFYDVRTLPIEQYSMLYDVLVTYRQTIDKQFRLRTASHLSLFYAGMSQASIRDETKALLLSTGALDLVAEYLEDKATPTPSTRRIGLR